MQNSDFSRIHREESELHNEYMKKKRNADREYAKTIRDSQKTYAREMVDGQNYWENRKQGRKDMDAAMEQARVTHQKIISEAKKELELKMAELEKKKKKPVLKDPFTPKVELTKFSLRTGFNAPVQQSLLVVPT